MRRRTPRSSSGARSTAFRAQVTAAPPGPAASAAAHAAFAAAVRSLVRSMSSQCSTAGAPAT